MTELINKSLIEKKWLRNQPNQEKKMNTNLNNFDPFFLFKEADSALNPFFKPLKPKVVVYVGLTS